MSEAEPRQPERKQPEDRKERGGRLGRDPTPDLEQPRQLAFEPAAFRVKQLKPQPSLAVAPGTPKRAKGRRPSQLELPGVRRRKRRPGAKKPGRKAQGPFPKQHRRRPPMNPRHPQHIAI